MPLDGIRVLDFTWVVAGPVACRILADHGAEVIKLERKVPGTLGPRRVGLQGDLNRNKRSVAINMGTARGIELARALAARSDIVIDNFSARVMRGWGMDYSSLAEIKPDIICISMSGLGHTGPRASYVSYGPTLQALGGFTAMMRDEDGAPAGYGYSYADMAGGYTGALAALIAMWSRRRTGKGQFVDLSQFEALTSVDRSGAARYRGQPARAGSLRSGARRKGRRRRTESIDAARESRETAATTIDGSRFRSARTPSGSDSSPRSDRRRGPPIRSSARCSCERATAASSTSTSRDGLPIRTPKTRWP